MLRAWGTLVGGNVAGGVLQFLATVAMARAIGAEELGHVALVLAYALLIDSLLNFQSVNVLTRFLAEAGTRGDRAQLHGLMRAGFLVDAATALLATLVAAASLPFVASLVGLPADWTLVAAASMAVILTRVIGTAEAVLRCLDRFWAIGMRGAVQGGLTLAGVLAAWAAGAPAWAYLAAAVLAEAAANALFVTLALRAAARRWPGPWWRADARAAIRSAPGFWALMWQTNLSSGVRIFTQHGDMLIIGAVLGPAATGAMRAVKGVSGFVSMVGRPIQQIASAKLAEAWAEGRFDAFARLAIRLSLISGMGGMLIALVTLWLGDWIMATAYGSNFSEYGLVLAIMVVGQAIYLAGVTLLPAMIAAGLGRALFEGIVAGTATFAFVVAVTVDSFGLYGVAMAHAMLFLVRTIFCWVRLKDQILSARTKSVEG